MSSPTIKDVAKLAGVSISTVSRVMNDSKPVSPESRRKVLDAVNKLDFKPNELARSLVMRRSNMIGVVVKDLGINYMAQVVRGLEEIGRMYNYDILLCSTYGNLETEKRIIDFLFTKQVEAIAIISENISPEVIVKLKEHQMPFIQMDAFYDGDLNTVSIDYEDAAYHITQALVRQNHKNILYVSDFNNKGATKAKYQGYSRALKESGYKTSRISVDESSINGGYLVGEVVVRMMKEHNITAAFASEDHIAIGLINYCYDNDVNVPQDLSVVGFGDDALASIYRPSLTTVREPFYDIGAVAMRRLVKELKNEEKIDSTVYLPYEIIQRESSKEKK